MLLKPAAEPAVSARNNHFAPAMVRSRYCYCMLPMTSEPLLNASSGLNRRGWILNKRQPWWLTSRSGRQKGPLSRLPLRGSDGREKRKATQVLMSVLARNWPLEASAKITAPTLLGPRQQISRSEHRIEELVLELSH